MTFDYVLTSLSLSTSLVSLIALKLTLPDIIRKIPQSQQTQDQSQTYLDTVKFLLKRLTFLEFFMVRKSLYKLNHLMFLGMTILFSTLISSTVYWGWAIGTLVSAGIYLIVELAMETRNSSHENTYWKRTLIYSIMTLITISCCVISFASIRFINIDITNFIKSIAVSICIDQFAGRPILILLLSLILQESEKMARLIKRYEFIEANISIVAILEEPSQEDIRSRAERLQIDDIVNQDVRKYPIRILNRIENRGETTERMSDEINTRRSARFKSRTKLPPVHIHLGASRGHQAKYESKNLNKQNEIGEGKKIESNSYGSRRFDSRNGRQDEVREKQQIKEVPRRAGRLHRHKQKQIKQKEYEIESSQKLAHNDSNQEKDEEDISNGKKTFRDSPIKFQLQQKDDIVYYFSTLNHENKDNEKQQFGQREIQKIDMVAKDNHLLSSIHHVHQKSNDQHIDTLIKVLTEEDNVGQDYTNLKDSSEAKNQFLPSAPLSINQPIEDIIECALNSYNNSIAIKQNSNTDNLSNLQKHNNIEDVTHKNNQAIHQQNIEAGQNQIEQLKVTAKSPHQKLSKKLDIYMNSIDTDELVEDAQMIDQAKQLISRRKPKTINLNRTLEVVDADQQQFVGQSTPKKIRSNSQDPHYPLKATKKYKHNSSQKSALKKSILEITENNIQQDDLEHIELAPVNQNVKKKVENKKVYKRKNFKTLFKGDSPYLEYLPNMLTKQIKNQLSEKKPREKENVQILHERNVRNLATISHPETRVVRPF